MIFTAEQINEIKRRLAEEGIKDSDLPSADKIEGDELCAIVQGGINKKMPLWKLFNSPAFETYYQLLQNTITDRMNQLEGLIEQVKRENLSVSDEFGDSDTITISQKTLTDAINKIWTKIEDMTGEVIQGFSMQVTPEYYIGETGADVHIQANTVETNGIFEHIAFYGNGALIVEADNVDFFEHNFHVDETTAIKCVAKIMGIEYERQSVITHYSSFLLGSGNSYADLMDGNNRFLPQYAIPITNGMRGAYDVNVAEGNRIIIVVGDSLKAEFIRADLNGVEIQFTETTCTDADGKVYAVFTSEPWNEGRYNIDING